MTNEELLARIAELESKNSKLVTRLQSKQKLTPKVGEKGGVSVYGLGRFPTSLYYSQWVRLIDWIETGELREFLEEAKSAGRLTLKDGE